MAARAGRAAAIMVALRLLLLSFAIGATIALQNGVALTPPQAWTSWLVSIHSALQLSAADITLTALGLKKDHFPNRRFLELHVHCMAVDYHVQYGSTARGCIIHVQYPAVHVHT